MRSRPPPDNEAKRAVAAAVRPILAPLGLKQKGHSRHWIGDQRYWLALVEFEPDGAHAKVGAQFLWSAESHLVFDHGRRIEAATAEALARQAAGEIVTLRQTFASVADIARHFSEAADGGDWPLFHRAVATALAGDTTLARDLFARLAAKPAASDWQKKLHADASDLARHLPDAPAFRAAIAETINRARALHGLAADAGCLA